MKNSFISIHAVLCFFLSILVVHFAIAQTKITPEEARAMAEELQKKAMSGKMSPAEIEAFKKRMGVNQAPAKSPAQTKVNQGMQKVSLAGLPAQVSGAPLKTFVNGMMKKIEPKLSKAQRDVADEILTKMDTNSRYISQYAVYFYQQGDDLLAAYISGSAVALDPDNDLNTNNFATILIESGAPAHAIPVMRGLVQRYPKTNMFLNNIGQAFAGCGMKDSAMYYFIKCMLDEPKHPAANKTAAKISQSNGKKQDAIKYAKNAAEAGLDEEVMDLLDELDPDGDHYSGFVKKTGLPDYFNMYKIRKPRHQRVPEEYEIVMAERAAFREEMGRYKGEISKIYNEEQKLGQKQLDKDLKEFQNYVFTTGRTPGAMPITPLVKKAMKIYVNRYIQVDLPKKIKKLKDEFDTTIAVETRAYEFAIQNINREFAEKKKPYDCGEGNGAGCQILEQLTKRECTAMNERHKVYLNALANAGDSYDQKLKQYASEIFYHKSKWGYLVGINQHLANANYYAAAIEYLTTIEKMVSYYPTSPHCVQLMKSLEKFTFAEIMKPVCPINVNFDFGVIQTKMNCKEAVVTLDLGKAIKAMDNWKLQFKQDHVKKSTTYAVIRVIIKKEIKGPSGIGNFVRLNAGAKAEVTATAYVTVDGKGGDYGVKAAAMGSAWVEDPLNVLESRLQSEFGYEVSLGANSGFTHGPKGLTGFFN
ncbi:MAG: tetratricopeptide repeat protein [Pseudobacter sp.]|uniref:tetratricopeptide repeat protein n=1 Tax=Pseudobacter sp. TaxID=2045420 RepID=UPI003F818AAF